jgi:hypothetical protein
MASSTSALIAVSVTAVKAVFNGGTVRIYGGTVPANASASLGAAVLLAEMTLANPAFGATSVSGNDVVCQTPAPISDSAANATGTASFFRMMDTGGTLVEQGTAGGAGSGAEMILTQPALVAGGPVEITSITLRQAFQ